MFYLNRRTVCNVDVPTVKLPIVFNFWYNNKYCPLCLPGFSDIVVTIGIQCHSPYFVTLHISKNLV
jgi:hypothetical protein